ncbi:MAG: hypothetical protein MZV70_08605 [Desulfobacterales bacterium]|nr:hypothetical protein [Desulfobacterales bacterium]
MPAASASTARSRTTCCWTRDLMPLADYFNRAGYRTVRAMPGTLWPWPEGGFYRYGQTFIAPDFGYRGPGLRLRLHAGPVRARLGGPPRSCPDAPGPLFAEIILTGSHAAFDIQAPYIDRLGPDRRRFGVPRRWRR